MTTLIQRGLEIVPGYTLIRRVGSGMAGEVWVARASGGVHVAIKIIRDMDMVGSKRELGALRIVREVKHTNLCPLIGVWFFDRDGELLSNSATDEILGRESSLIDTAFVSGNDKPGDLRETASLGWDDRPGFDTHPDSGNEFKQNDSVIGSDSSFAETTDISAIGADQANQSQATSPSPSGSEEKSDSQSATNPTTDANPLGKANPLGEAQQMVVAMGLGDRTLFDRLLEMRAPGNLPDDDDSLHLPGGIHVKELLQYISGAASAIDELNLNHNIYHCDIKPQNILIVGGNAQVCDFGLARRVQENRRTQLAIGTPAYGAPEMLFDQTYTKTIDQYSLAITYYELRTGKLPFETTRRSMFLRAKAQGELQLTAVASAEQEVIAKATHLDSELRYPSCTAFVDALTEAVYAKPKANYRNVKWAIATATVLSAAAIPTALNWPRPEITASAKSATAAPTTTQEATVSEIAETPVIEMLAPQSTDIDPDDEPSNVPAEIVVEPEPDMKVPPSKVAVTEDAFPIDASTNPAKEMQTTSPAIEPTPAIAPEPKLEPKPTLEDIIAQATRLAQELIDTQTTPTKDSTSPDLVVRQRDLMSELDQGFGGTNKAGWELIEPSLRPFAITVAGQIHWNNKRVSDALKNWISIQDDSNLLKTVPADWRHSVAEQTLQWLIQNSKVSDQETTRHRYSKLAVRANGVLRLAERFASDSETQSRRIDFERFLLAAAEEDTLNGLKLWDSLKPTKPECSPQVGFALASLTSARLAQAKQIEERTSLINLRLLASNLKCNDPSDAATDATSADLRWKEHKTCFQWLNEIVQPKQDQLPTVSLGVEKTELGVFASGYVTQACKRLTSADHDEFRDQLDNIELAAAITSMHSESAHVREAMRLTSVEAFLQSRYEQTDDVPAAKLIGRLRSYGKLVDSDRPMDRLVSARVVDQDGFVSRDAKEMRRAYDEARSLYTSVIEDIAAPPDVRGSAARCRASLFTRIAAIADIKSKDELLRQANEDAQLALQLPERWHLDTDDRLMTAAEANLAMVRLLNELPVSEKQRLLDDADQYLSQAIAEREKRRFPSFQHATLRLNGYLLDLLNASDQSRLRERETLARQWMGQIAKSRITEERSQANPLPTRTINSSSSRLRCHWHCMCSMVLSALKEPGKAMAEIEYAHQIALENLEPSDDRRHFATLVLVQLKSPPLFQSIAKGQRPNPELIAELTSLLESIVDPMPDFQAKKSLYQKELAALGE